MQPPLWNEGRSIHIGVDRVGPVYRGWLETLRSAEADAAAMRALADTMGFASRLIVGEAASRENVQNCLEATIERLVDGDVLLVTFAGHMTSITGVGDDPDGWDEAWCLHDGIVLDDDFHDLLADVPAGADVVVVTDSCFAAGMVDTFGRVAGPGAELPAGRAAADASSTHFTETLIDAGAGDGRKLIPRTPHTRLGDLEIGRLVREGALPRARSRPASERRQIGARVVALAAAEEGSLAFDGELHGLFTAAFLNAIEDLRGADVSYEALVVAIAERLPFQRPTLGTFGRARADVLGAHAFRSASADPERRPDSIPLVRGPFGTTGG